MVCCHEYCTSEYSLTASTQLSNNKTMITYEIATAHARMKVCKIQTLDPLMNYLQRLSLVFDERLPLLLTC